MSSAPSGPGRALAQLAAAAADADVAAGREFAAAVRAIAATHLAGGGQGPVVLLFDLASRSVDGPAQVLDVARLALASASRVLVRGVGDVVEVTVELDGTFTDRPVD